MRVKCSWRPECVKSPGGGVRSSCETDDADTGGRHRTHYSLQEPKLLLTTELPLQLP